MSMGMLMVSDNSYLESLLQGQPQLPRSPLAWFNQLRANAVDRGGHAESTDYTG